MTKEMKLANLSKQINQSRAKVTKYYNRQEKLEKLFEEVEATK